MWNDRDAPIAYLITFRCYGTWLHGDERGSINRFNNKYLSPYLEANETWENQNKAKLKSEPISLNSRQRKIVENTIREVCEYRIGFYTPSMSEQITFTRSLRPEIIPPHPH